MVGVIMSPNTAPQRMGGILPWLLLNQAVFDEIAHHVVEKQLLQGWGLNPLLRRIQFSP